MDSDQEHTSSSRKSGRVLSEVEKIVFALFEQ